MRLKRCLESKTGLKLDGMIGKIKKLNKQSLILLCTVAVFYMFFCFAYGVQICADSKGYMKMISAREPVYPLFLAFLRMIFGKNGYLWAAIIIQNILMIIAVVVSVLWLKNRFKLSWIITYVMVLSYFAVVILCQFVAKRSSIYSNSILTEGIAQPLWIILMLLIWKCVIDDNMKYIFYSAALAAFMMDIRKQMAVGFIVICMTVFFVWLGKKGFWKRIGLTILACVTGVAIALIGTRIYNYALRGEFAQNTRDMNLVLTTTLYVADMEDESLIKDESAREIFVDIMRILDSKKANIKYAGSSLGDIQSHYTDMYDVITIDTTADAFVDYAVEHGFDKGVKAEAEADRLSGEIVNSLFKDNIGKYSKVYASSLCEGFVNTVAKRNPILDIYATLAYIAYFVLTLLCISRTSTRKAGLIGLTVLFAIIANVVVTAALIFCQTRYMMYNMALFYVAGLLMLTEYIKVHMKHKKD